MTEHPVPDIVLERYRLNELPEDERRKLTARLDRIRKLRERLALLERSDEELREPVERLRVSLRARRRPARRGLWCRRVGRACRRRDGRAIAFAVVSRPARACCIGRPRQRRRREAASRRWRSIVAPRRERAAGRRRYRACRRSHSCRVSSRGRGATALIVSIDGGGMVTMHLPASSDRAVAAGRTSPIVLLDACLRTR